MNGDMGKSEEVHTAKDRLFSSGNPKLQDILKNRQEGQEKRHTGVQPGKVESETNIYANELLVQVQRRVISEINPLIVKDVHDEKALGEQIEEVLSQLSSRDYPTLSNKEKSQIIKSLLDEFLGLGPLQKLLSDPSISEIMVNGPNQVYVEKKGQLVISDTKFRNNEHVMQIIDKIVSPLGRRIDESSPMVDARLPDGSRVNAIIPPLSLKGPVLTIRKFSPTPFSLNTLISFDTLTERMGTFLDCAIKAKLNILVAGGTGSGKTTFLNVLSSLIPDRERIVTIEDAAELRLNQPHVIPLEARPPNIEGKGAITIRDLVRNSLRMRPDRIVIGEVRGAEALDMLQAMNTGHRGSLSTIHANSARDALSRLETMALFSGIDFPLRALREQVCSAIELIVYLERLSDGSRKITNISEVLGFEGDIIVLQEIFRFERTGKNGKARGEFVEVPIRPKTLDKFQALGINWSNYS